MVLAAPHRPLAVRLCKVPAMLADKLGTNRVNRLPIPDNSLVEAHLVTPHKPSPIFLTPHQVTLPRPLPRNLVAVHTAPDISPPTVPILSRILERKPPLPLPFFLPFSCTAFFSASISSLRRLALLSDFSTQSSSLIPSPSRSLSSEGLSLSAIRFSLSIILS